MKKVIEIKELTIKTRNEDRTIIGNLSFDVFEGEVILLKGRNGSGKSTLIKALIQEDVKKYKVSGSILFYGELNVRNIKKDKDLMKYRSQLSYVPQRDDYSGHYNITVSDVIHDSINSFAGNKIDAKYIEEHLSKFKFEQIDGSNEKFSMQSAPNKLSGGQQRILTILANVLSRPGAPLYIIDEPLNNLDSKNIPNVVNIFRQLHLDNPKSSFLIVTHNELFDFIDRIIEL